MREISAVYGMPNQTGPARIGHVIQVCRQGYALPESQTRPRSAMHTDQIHAPDQPRLASRLAISRNAPDTR